MWSDLPGTGRDVSEFSDKRLLRSYCDGDQGAFDVIYRRYVARVYGTAYRLTASYEDAEDTIQEVFLRLASKASTIRKAGALSAWIYRTTVNCATDCLRRRRSTLSLDDQSTKATLRIITVESLRRQSQRDLALRRESLLDQVEAKIPELPERQAAAFVLRAFQGLTHREIGAVLGIAEGSAKSHYSLACRRLRELVKTQSMKRGETCNTERTDDAAL